MKPALIARAVFAGAVVLALDACCAPETPLGLDAQTAAIKTLQSDLLAVAVANRGDDPDVPPAARDDISELKSRLAGLTDAYLAVRPNELDPSSVEGELATMLSANRSSAPKPRGMSSEAVSGLYGANLEVKVAGQPDVLTVAYRFGIDCGSDALLLVYQHNENAWKRALRWQAAPYDLISGAFGDGFQYRLLPGEVSGAWRIAAVHGYPWCSSNFSEFAVDVLQPQPGTDQPAIIFHDKQGYRRDEDLTLSARPDEFEVNANYAISLDSDVVQYPAVFRYAESDGTYSRVPPLATTPRDFVDQWLQQPWSDALRWSMPKNLAELERIHRIPAALQVADEENETTDWSYGPVLACRDPGRTQVELDSVFREGTSETQSAPLYFQLTGREGDYRMSAASAHPDPQCLGH